MAGPDQLYMLKNYFWSGNFQSAVKEAATLHLSDPALVVQRDVIVYRAYIALKQFSVVLGELSAGGAAPALQAVRLAAAHASGADAPAALSALEALAAGEGAGATETLLAATALAAEGRQEDALRTVQPLVAGSNLEGMALRVVVLLAMRRVDLARGDVAAMAAVDDDAALTQLCGAWVALAGPPGEAAEGGGLGEAVLVFKDLSDRFGASATLLNGRAVALMALGQHEDAGKLLADATGSPAAGPATTINLVALARLSGKDGAEEHAAALAVAEPACEYVAAAAAAERSLERIVTQYAPAAGAASA